MRGIKRRDINMKNKFIMQNYLLLATSFKKISLKIFLILAFDILFYFIFMQMGNFFLRIIEKKAANVDLAQNLLGLSQQAASGLLTSTRGFFFFIIFSAVLFLLLMVIHWSVFKGLIWMATTNKKFEFRFFRRFLLLNLIWLPSWLLLVFLFVVIISQETFPIFMIAALAAAFYFTNILYPLFLKESKLSRIKEAFGLGIKKIHYFIVPYAAIIILFFIILNAYNFIAVRLNLNPNVFFGILLIFIAWMRHYFVEIVGSLSK